MNDDKMIPEEILEKYPHFNGFIKKKDKYILDENKNVIEADLMTWAKFLEDKKNQRIIKKETIKDLLVSTIFIGLDHNLAGLIIEGAHRPHIFETMVFNSVTEIYCDRYSTWKEAEEGHAKAGQWVN